MLLGFRLGSYSGLNWYGSLIGKDLSVLSVIASPIAMVGTHLARTGRARLAWAAVLVGTAVVALLSAVALMVQHQGVNQELVIETIAATVIIGLAAILAVEAYRRIAPSSVRPALATSILVWVLVVAALAAFMPMQTLTYWPADVAPLWVLATLSLALPLAPRTRVAVGALVAGAMVTIVLYLLGPDLYTGTAVTAAGCLVIAVVAVVHLRPVYLSLRDQSPPPGS